MTKPENTPSAGTRAESATANGHSGHDVATDIAEWIPGVMVADEIDARPDDAIRDAVDPATWKALRSFGRKFGVDVTVETTFEDLNAVPADVAESAGLEFTRGKVVEFIAEYARPLDDPHDLGKRLVAERAQRFRDENRITRELAPKGIAADTAYTFAEIERVCGEDVAARAEELIDRNNRDVWRTSKPHRLTERLYLGTAGELHSRLGVSGAVIATMVPATPEERDGALERLAVTRRRHAEVIARKAKTSPTPRQRLDDVIRHISEMIYDAPTGSIVNGLVYEQMVISWVGTGGVYKTFVALGMACSVATGRNFTQQLTVPQKQPVLYLCAENRHYGLIGDVAAWCRHHNVDIADVQLHGWNDVVQLGDEERMAELTEYAVAHGIKLIVFDTQSKATRNLEENSASDMRDAMANAESLAKIANAAVVIVHHTARGQDHGRGSSAGRDNTDATIFQKSGGPLEADITIDKHKSVESGVRYPVKLEKVTVTLPSVTDDMGVTRGGETFTTLVACPRDPLTIDETSEKLWAALNPNDKILVAVVNEHDGAPLSPAEVQRCAETRGYTGKKDATARHLRTLARPGYGFIRETVNPVSARRTYSPPSSAGSQDGE